MTPTLVLNVVGLTQELLGEHTPNLSELARQSHVRPIDAVTPAVTCSAQATYLTGKLPSEHGIVANGWYFRDLSEVWLWRQSNRLVQSSKVWDLARERNAKFTVANLFWWYNMYSSVDWAVTPRPMYPADGRKLPDVYSWPPELRGQLQDELGTFPLFHFWGPVADIRSSRWITEAALRVLEQQSPSLTLVYLPHLDYNLQRLGPDPSHPRLHQDLREVDELCGRLIDAARSTGRRLMVLSEYGITQTTDAIHINRALREAGLLAIREELGRELLDCGACRAFAVADHQIAHVYVNDPSALEATRKCLEKLDGVEHVLGAQELAAWGLAHERSGELVAISHADRWFSYYYWLESKRAPDFATTVDIHRKPGYDPVELFVDPKLVAPKLKIAGKLARKALGLRTLMDVISSEETRLVQGSHGRPTDDPKQGPMLIADLEPTGSSERVACTAVCGEMLRHLFD